MSRQRTQKTIDVPASRMLTVETAITCDRCGTTYDERDNAVNEIIIAMDPDECVSYAHRRDYCGDCADVIWKLMCAVIDVAPDAESTGYGE